jgi:hypothetical protein
MEVDHSWDSEKERDRQTITDLIDDIKKICFSGTGEDIPSHQDDFDQADPISSRPEFIETHRTYSVDELATDTSWYSEEFAATPDKETVIKLRQLGEQFLAEGWLVFGEKKEELRNGLIEANDDPDRQREILREAIMILDEIKAKNTCPDDERYNYNPLRLSPKLIGEYPETRLAPTCLSSTIILSSLLKQADIPTLFAGVMLVQEDYLTQEAEGASKRRLARICAANYPENATKEFLMGQLCEFFCGQGDDNGYHYAAYVKLADGWSVVDASFHLVAPVNEEANQKINAFGDKNLELDNLVGSAAIVQVVKRAKHYQGLLRKTLDCIEYDRPEVAEVAEFLANLDGESITQRIYQRFFARPEIYASNNRLTRLQELALKIQRKRNDLAADVRQMDLADAYFVVYSGDNGVWEFSERCQTDAGFRTRRAEDIIDAIDTTNQIELIMSWMDAMHQLDRQQILRSRAAQRGPKANFNRQFFKHAIVELRNTVEGIGFSVLNDFADTVDADINPRTWLSLSASDVAITAAWPNFPDDHPSRISLHKNQLDEVFLNNLVEMALRAAPFRNNRSKFLEARDTLRVMYLTARIRNKD